MMEKRITNMVLKTLVNFLDNAEYVSKNIVFLLDNFGTIVTDMYTIFSALADNERRLKKIEKRLFNLETALLISRNRNNDTMN